MMVMPVMKGGGAERVASLLMNEFHRCGYEVSFVLTSCKENEVVRTDLDKDIPLILVQEQLEKKKGIIDIWMKILRVISSVLCKPFEKAGIDVPAYFAYLSFISQYRKEIAYLRQIMERDSELTVITFLQPSIPMVALAGKGLSNKIIFSERGNPERLMKHRYGKKFVEKYYSEITNAVFQTENAKNAYPRNVVEKGVIIPNPIKGNLPETYLGERNKNITTFCRISLQKNLPMMVEAFYRLHKDHPEYRLRIIGDTFNEEGERVKKALVKQIQVKGIEEAVEFLPFSKNVHENILKDAMYVNSSDYEGMSNAMLEAMAIGMPVVCTDCPIGGAKAIIENNVNGFLVDVNDAEGMYIAMKEIIENSEKAKHLSINAAKLKEELSLENIAKRWMELV